METKQFLSYLEAYIKTQTGIHMKAGCITRMTHTLQESAVRPQRMMLFAIYTQPESASVRGEIFQSKVICSM